MSYRLRIVAGVVGLLVVGFLAVGADGVSGSPGQVRVLVVKATWGPQPVTDAEIDAVMQGVEHFYATASFGQMLMSYVQTPWLDVMPGPMECVDETEQLPRLAASAGWNSGAYDRIVFLTPGLGGPNVPGSIPNGCVNTFYDPAGVFINDYVVPPVGAVIHELGHSFGLGHAGLLTCWYQELKRMCSGDPYGDTADVMGGATGNLLDYVGDFGGLQKARAGWITPTYITKPGTYQPGTYRLAPLEVASTLPQALVIRGSAYEYWIDLREPVGNDAHQSGAAMTGLAVHRIADDPLAPDADPLLPDYLVPNAHSTSYYTGPGKTFILPGVFTLTALSRTHTVMTVRVGWLHSQS